MNLCEFATSVTYDIQSNMQYLYISRKAAYALSVVSSIFQAKNEIPQNSFAQIEALHLEYDGCNLVKMPQFLERKTCVWFKHTNSR